MHGTRSHRHSRPSTGPPPSAPQPYWGWSHQNQRMEFMDLPSYVGSFQQGYDAAIQNLTSAMGAAPGTTAPGGTATHAGAEPAHAWHGRHDSHGRHDHDRHEHEDHDRDHPWGEDCGCKHGEQDCGCGHKRDRDCGCHHGHECDCCEHDGRGERDCRCECCIVDADIIVYAHCGEVRVIPIEVANDTRKVREDVSVHVSEVRSGKVLKWPTLIRPEGPLTLEPCSKTKLELLVQISCCEEHVLEPAPTRAVKGAEPPSLLAAIADHRAGCGDVDRCEVGYTTIRLGGCLVRPIVVAIAVLPVACDTYRAGCSCSCCC